MSKICKHENVVPIDLSSKHRHYQCKKCKQVMMGMPTAAIDKEFNKAIKR